MANQLATVGLSLYLPLHGNGLYDLSPYYLRSVCTTGTNAGHRWREPIAAKAIAEIKLLLPLCLGDFYPLTPADLKDENWCAWQFDRPDLGEGVAVVFRRPKTSGSSFEVALHGLDPAAVYSVDFRETYDIRKTKRMSGRELRKVVATLDKRPSSLLIHYKKTETR